MSNYVPANDSELASWLYNLVTGLNDHLEDLGLVEADILPLQTDYTAFSGSVTALGTQRIALDAAMNDKKAKKTAVEATVRPLVQRIQVAPGMTDLIRGELQIPVRGSAMHTAGAMPPDVPKIYLETKPGTVWVHFGTDPANEKINGKPAGIKGCNIWRMKAGETKYQLLAFETASPYEDTVDGFGSDYTYVVQYRGTKAKDVGQSSIAGTIAARGAFVALAA
jgi:hypothetical protein